MQTQAMKEKMPATWVEEELTGCLFSDIRLGKRFRILVTQLSEGLGESIPLACQDWAGTKAAYRFFANERVTEADILSGHFKATRDRFKATRGTVLVLHDTTEFSFKRERKEAIGMTGLSYCGNGKDERPRLHTVCGILQHSSLAVTLEGLPLGIAAVKFWTRKKFKGGNALKHRVNPTRVPIEEKESMRWIENIRQSTALLQEPKRCIHIGDRESDIYELFYAVQTMGTHFLVRTCVDRRVGDRQHTVLEEMNSAPVQGMHTIEVRDSKGKASKAELEIRYRRLKIHPPVGPKAKRYPDVFLTVIHARERGTPDDREQVDWKLITDLPVTTCAEAVEKLKWYALRWNIETFHKILKSGCKAESSRLRSADRLLRLIAVFSILSWRIFWITMIGRSIVPASASLAFTTSECQILDQLMPDPLDDHPPEKSLASYIIKVARLGGYLNRAADPPPGNIVMWRGLSRLTDIELGFEMTQLVGN